MPGGVIFDMDGVLVDSAAAHERSWRTLLGRHGIEISDEQFRATFGQTSRDIIRTLWGSELPEREVRRYDQEKERIYRELISGRVPLRADAPGALAGLCGAGYVLAVATSGPPENLALVLNETRLGRFFSATVHGLEVARGKPAPDCFLLAARRAGLEPCRCAVVEDAPAGVAAALAAGMKAIGLAGTHPAERLKSAGAAGTVDRLSDITPELLAPLLSRP